MTITSTLNFENDLAKEDNISYIQCILTFILYVYIYLQARIV